MNTSFKQVLLAITCALAASPQLQTLAADPNETFPSAVYDEPLAPAYAQPLHPTLKPKSGQSAKLVFDVDRSSAVVALTGSYPFGVGGVNLSVNYKFTPQPFMKTISSLDLSKQGGAGLFFGIPNWAALSLKAKLATIKKGDLNLSLGFGKEAAKRIKTRLEWSRLGLELLWGTENFNHLSNAAFDDERVWVLPTGLVIGLRKPTAGESGFWAEVSAAAQGAFSAQNKTDKVSAYLEYDYNQYTKPQILGVLGAKIGEKVAPFAGLNIGYKASDLGIYPMGFKACQFEFKRPTIVSISELTQQGYKDYASLSLDFRPSFLPINVELCTVALAVSYDQTSSYAKHNSGNGWKSANDKKVGEEAVAACFTVKLKDMWVNGTSWTITPRIRLHGKAFDGEKTANRVLKDLLAFAFHYEVDLLKKS